MFVRHEYGQQIATMRPTRECPFFANLLKCEQPFPATAGKPGEILTVLFSQPFLEAVPKSPCRKSIPQPGRISQNRAATVLLWARVFVSQLGTLTERPTACIT